jgi:copper chaperone CopZ
LTATISLIDPSTFRLCAAANRQKFGELEYWLNSPATDIRTRPGLDVRDLPLRVLRRNRAYSSGFDAMIAFQITDMKDARGATAVTKAVKALDRAAVVRVDLPTRTIEIDPAKASARQLGDAIRQAGYCAEAA